MGKKPKPRVGWRHSHDFHWIFFCRQLQFNHHKRPLLFLCASPDVPRRVQLVCTARQFLPGYNFRRGFQAGYEVEKALDGPVDIAISFRQDKKRIFCLELWEKCESERLFWIESNEVWREEVAVTLLSQTGHDKLRFEFNELVLPSTSARQNLSASLRQPVGHEVKWRKKKLSPRKKRNSNWVITLVIREMTLPRSRKKRSWSNKAGRERLILSKLSSSSSPLY